MRMNDLLKTSFFSLLSESSQELMTKEMGTAYENFVKQVETLNQPDGDYTSIYRILNLTCIELTSLLKHYRYKQGEKCA